MSEVQTFDMFQIFDMVFMKYLHFIYHGSCKISVNITASVFLFIFHATWFSDQEYIALLFNPQNNDQNLPFLTAIWMYFMEYVQYYSSISKKNADRCSYLGFMAYIIGKKFCIFCIYLWSINSAKKYSKYKHFPTTNF